MKAEHTDNCVQKGERYECLHPIDAEHFWIGDLMVDINLLKYEELRMSRDKVHYTDWQVHEVGVGMSTVRNYARKLAKGEEVSYTSVAFALKKLNNHGLHTGYGE